MPKTLDKKGSMLTKCKKKVLQKWYTSNCTTRQCENTRPVVSELFSNFIKTALWSCLYFLLHTGRGIQKHKDIISVMFSKMLHNKITRQSGQKGQGDELIAKQMW